MITNSPSLDCIKIHPSLNALIEQHRKTLSYNNFCKFLSHVDELFKKYQHDFLHISPGANRAKIIHRLIDQELELVHPLKYTCSKGCGYCCYLEVEITQDEGELLTQLILDGHKIDRNRLEIQGNRERKSNDWIPILKPENQCIFLGTNNICSIYENRPSICRKHLVTTPPTKCADAHGNPMALTVPIATVIISAAVSLPNNPYCSLPKCVLGMLNKLEQKNTLSNQILKDSL